MNYSTKIYVADNGRCPYKEWLSSLDGKTQARILSRIARLDAGNFGDTRGVGEGVQELRLHFGAGYRVYYGIAGGQVVLLLLGGSKRKQTKDIKAAKAIWRDYQGKLC